MELLDTYGIRGEQFRIPPNTTVNPREQGKQSTRSEGETSPSDLVYLKMLFLDLVHLRLKFLVGFRQAFFYRYFAVPDRGQVAVNDRLDDVEVGRGL